MLHITTIQGITLQASHHFEFKLSYGRILTIHVAFLFVLLAYYASILQTVLLSAQVFCNPCITLISAS